MEYMEKRDNKKIFLFGYSKANLGDDLFVYILANRYKNVDFFIHIENEKYKKFLNNIDNVKCLKEHRIVDNINIEDYDGFIYIGGSVFIESDYARHEAKEFNTFLNKIKQSNKPFFYMSCNFGPYQTKEYLKQIEENLKLCKGVCFRDRNSYNIFKNISQVRIGADLAYIYDYKEFAQIKRQRSIGISVIDLSIRDALKEKNDIYIDYIKRIIIKFAKRKYKVCLISFCEFENDEIVIEQVLKQVPEKYTKYVHTLRYRGDLEQFLKEYSKYKYMVCTRFHSMILSTIFKQKLYNLAYSKKTNNFIEDYELFNKVYDIKELSYDTIMKKNEFKKVKRKQNKEFKGKCL